MQWKDHIKALISCNSPMPRQLSYMLLVVGFFFPRSHRPFFDHLFFTTREQEKKICYLQWRMRQSEGKSAFDTNLIECQRFIIPTVCACVCLCAWRFFSLGLRPLFARWLHAARFFPHEFAITVKFTVSHSTRIRVPFFKYQRQTNVFNYGKRKILCHFNFDTAESAQLFLRRFTFIDNEIISLIISTNIVGDCYFTNWPG